MTTVNNVTIAYNTNSMTFTLSTGESFTIAMVASVGDGYYGYSGFDYLGYSGYSGVTPESLAQSEVRAIRVFDALRQAQLRVINSLGDIANLP